MSVHQPSPVPGRHRLPDDYRMPADDLLPSEHRRPPRKNTPPEGFLDESNRSIDSRDDDRRAMANRLGPTLTTVAVPERAAMPSRTGPPKFELESTNGHDRSHGDDWFRGGTFDSGSPNGHTANGSHTNGSGDQRSDPAPMDDHLRAIFQVTPTPLLLLSPHSKVREANAAAEKLTGRSVADLRGLDVFSLFADGVELQVEVEGAGRGGAPVSERPSCVVRADRTEHPVIVSVAAVRDPSGTSTDLVVNLMERSAPETTPDPVDDSFSDPLTGLPSRPQFFDRLHDAVLTGHRDHSATSVVMLRVVGMLRLPAELGTDSAERAAAELATTLRSGIRTGDSVAALGDDVFAVICRDTRAKDAGVVAERLRVATSGTVSAHGHTVVLTTTARVSSADGTEESSVVFSSLTRQVDGHLAETAPSQGYRWE